MVTSGYKGRGTVIDVNHLFHIPFVGEYTVISWVPMKEEVTFQPRHMSSFLQNDCDSYSLLTTIQTHNIALLIKSLQEWKMRDHETFNITT